MSENKLRTRTSAAARPTSPPKADQTTKDNPWPLALLSRNLKDYLGRLPSLWVSGQVVEYKPRAGTRMAFFVVRDLDENLSVTVKAFANVVDQAGPGFDEGARIVLQCKPDFYEVTGQLSLHASQIHTQGLGDLLAQIEALRRKLAGEGLFDSSHKRPLPVLPRRVGLICGRNAKAKHDVIVNAQLRWPTLDFEVREVAVQGQYCVAEVSAALAQLDEHPNIDVIVIARGGGAVEDLLPFSDEALVRQCANTKTPLVSAIGHETDCPLLDLVADYRASTPTDAARKIVPDWAQELEGLQRVQDRADAVMKQRLQLHRQELSALCERPVMARPSAMVQTQIERLEGVRTLLSSQVLSLFANASAQLGGLRQALAALSPYATLQRGYAIVRNHDGDIIQSSEQVLPEQHLQILLGQGSVFTQVTNILPPSLEKASK